MAPGLPALVNASSGLLFVAMGVFCILVSRKKRRPVLLGLLAVGYGSNFIVTNLWAASGQWPLGPLLVHSAADTLVAFAGVALAFDIVRGLPRPQRRAFAVVAAAVAALLAVAVALVALRSGRYLGQTAVAATTPAQVLTFFTVSAGLFLALSLVVVACAFAYRGATARERVGLASLAVAFGAWPAFFLPILLIGATGLGNALFVSAVIVASCSWVVALGGGDARMARRTLFGLLGVGVLGAALGAFFGLSGTSDFGTPGVLRTLVVALLAVAIFRHDLLGVPLPRLASKRGPLAAGTLAVLLIVAQVAQNFLESRYGLLMGGVVAGAFLFAAHPIQRAIEDRGHRRLPVVETALPGPERARRDAAYLGACRLAMRDKRLTRAEEAHLHRLADELGLSPSRAHELLVQAEQEAGVA